MKGKIAALLQKGVISAVPHSEVWTFSPYSLVPKKSGGMRPILDLCILNSHIVWRPFRMLMVKQLLEYIRPGDWITFIDLTDVYFHVPILPRNRKYL